jgi:hypothetical protein
MGTILKMNMRRRRRAAGVLLVMKSRKPLVIQDAGVSPGGRQKQGGKNKVAETRWQKQSGRNKVIETRWQKQSGRNKVAETKWQKQSGRNKMAEASERAKETSDKTVHKQCTKSTKLKNRDP